jgi:hypothetical protein
MSTDGAATNSESAPICWTALDERFFSLVGDLLSSTFLWGAATMLASYDPDPDAGDAAPANSEMPRPSRPGESLPRQRGLDGWTLDPQGRLRYGSA